MVTRAHPLAVVLMLALTAITAGAQAPARPVVSIPLGAPTLTVQTNAIPSATVGPVLRSSAVGVLPARQNVPLAQTGALAPANNRAQSTTLMIVGGVALIVGAIIGGTPGTIFMVGGGVVGLIGLYNYLQ